MLNALNLLCSACQLPHEGSLYALHQVGLSCTHPSLTSMQLAWRPRQMTAQAACRLRKDMDANLLAAQADDLGLEMIEAQCAATGDPGELARHTHCRPTQKPCIWAAVHAADAPPHSLG